jgi:hypothetical protein
MGEYLDDRVSGDKLWNPGRHPRLGCRHVVVEPTARWFEWFRVTLPGFDDPEFP